jgi:anti-sigma B factor antagonist
MAEAGLNVSQTGAAYVVRFQDASILDAATVQRISGELYEVVEKPGAKLMLLAFQDVRFLCSHALGVLLTLQRRADAAGVKVAFAGLRPELVRVFRLTKLDEIFDLFESEPEALAHFGMSGDRPAS